MTSRMFVGYLSRRSMPPAFISLLFPKCAALGGVAGKFVRASRGKFESASRGKFERASRGKFERASRGKFERASRGKIKFTAL